VILHYFTALEDSERNGISGDILLMEVVVNNITHVIVYS